MNRHRISASFKPRILPLTPGKICSFRGRSTFREFGRLVRGHVRSDSRLKPSSQARAQQRRQGARQNGSLSRLRKQRPLQPPPSLACPSTANVLGQLPAPSRWAPLVQCPAEAVRGVAPDRRAVRSRGPCPAAPALGCAGRHCGLLTHRPWAFLLAGSACPRNVTPFQVLPWALRSPRRRLSLLPLSTRLCRAPWDFSPAHRPCAMRLRNLHLG